MRDFETELKNRVQFIKDIVNESGASGIVYGNSGGKDSTLVGILCKLACGNTLGLIMPCSSRRNYNEDKTDAKLVARIYNIETREVHLDQIKDETIKCINDITKPKDNAINNIAPRIRMSVLYAVANSENRLVAGTGNKSESFVGYFTKWGDGAFDFNPIADLTVTEIYEFLKFIKAPNCIINKAPSAGLFDGQTDEGEMGVSYMCIDEYLTHGTTSDKDKFIIDKLNKSSEHKRRIPRVYGGMYEN